MRPAGPARLALLAVLQAGAVGTFDALARQAQVPVSQARQTLKNLRYQGAVDSIRPSAHNCGQPQRARAIYQQAANDGACAFDALSFVRQVWR